MFALCPNHWFSAWSDRTVKRRGYEYESLKKAIGQLIWEQCEMLFPKLVGKVSASLCHFRFWGYFSMICWYVFWCSEPSLQRQHMFLKMLLVGKVSASLCHFRFWGYFSMICWYVFWCSEPSLQRQHLFLKMLPLKWICCCKESLTSKLMCNKIFLFLLPHRICVLDICKNRLTEAILRNMQNMFLEVLNENTTQKKVYLLG